MKIIDQIVQIGVFFMQDNITFFGSKSNDLTYNSIRANL